MNNSQKLDIFQNFIYNYNILRYKRRISLSNYTLDFSLTTEEQRCEAITSICSQSTFTCKQYTQMADYILLAKNPNSDLKIYPEEFRSPYSIHEEQSLDEIMDNPFLEQILDTSKPLSSATYGTKKRRISRDNKQHANIPGMQQLWHDIDNLKEICSTSSATHAQHHLLIELYKQQYSLLESFLPNDNYSTPIPNFFHNYKLSSLYKEKLCEPTYMGRFLIQLPLLIELSYHNEELEDLIHLVRQALSLITLSPLQQDILTLYQKAIPTKQALAYLSSHYRPISQSYMSIILYKQIATKVVEEYSELYHREVWANDPTKWRTCICCKQSKLLTKHNWYHFSNKPQGFALICKECTKAKKEAKHNAKLNNNLQ